MFGEKGGQIVLIQPGDASADGGVPVGPGGRSTGAGALFGRMGTGTGHFGIEKRGRRFEDRDMTPVRLGLLGLHHDHIWGNLKDLSETDGLRVVAYADHHAALRERAAGHFPEAEGHGSYEALLARHDLDAVFIFASNRLGEELAVAACERGWHVLVEKPMASTLAGADRMLSSARAHRVRLMVNWPIAWMPGYQEALRLAASGFIGELWQVKYRAAHAGPRELGCSVYFCEWLYDPALNGGGALLDYGCYGAALSRALLGTPQAVTAVTLGGLKSGLSAEDNAVLLFQYPRALGIAEASWTQSGDLTSYVAAIHGSKGTLLAEPGGRLLLANAEHPEGRELEAPRPPPHLASATSHFLHLIRDPGAECFSLCHPVVGRDAQAMLEAALRSAREGRRVSWG